MSTGDFFSFFGVAAAAAAGFVAGVAVVVGAAVAVSTSAAGVGVVTAAVGDAAGEVSRCTVYRSVRSKDVGVLYLLGYRDPG